MSEPVAKAILLCTFCSQDKANRWSLVAVFDNVYLQSLPAQVAPFFAWARIADPPKSGRFMFQLEDPAGIVLWTSGPQLYEIPADAKGTGIDVYFNVPPVVVTAFGKHRVAVYVNADRLTDTPLSVTAAPEKVPK